MKHYGIKAIQIISVLLLWKWNGKNNDSLDFSQRSKLFGESANSYRDLFNFK